MGAYEGLWGLMRAYEGLWGLLGLMRIYKSL